MAYFGIKYNWNGQIITIKNQKYKSKPFTVEADWSAASYYYAIAAFANDDLDLQLNGLFAESVQGDSVVAKIGEEFGVHSEFNDAGVRLTKVKNPKHLCRYVFFNGNYINYEFHEITVKKQSYNS